MAAGMSNARKRVILAEKSDIRTALAFFEDSLKGRLQAADSLFHLEAFLLQPACQKPGRPEFRQAQLRMVENIVSHLCKLQRLTVSTGVHPLFIHHKNLLFRIRFRAFSIPVKEVSV